MSCCLASSREMTTMRAGMPSSPVSSRLTTAWPSDPVPPVTRTFLPSTSMLSPLVVGGRVARELFDHRVPRRRGITGRGREPAAVEAAIDRHRGVGPDGQSSTERPVQPLQQILLADRRARDMVYAGEVRMPLNHVEDDAAELRRREAGKNGLR